MKHHIFYNGKHHDCEFINKYDHFDNGFDLRIYSNIESTDNAYILFSEKYYDSDIYHASFDTYKKYLKLIGTTIIFIGDGFFDINYKNLYPINDIELRELKFSFLYNA